jgi:hypothetical protein
MKPEKFRKWLVERIAETPWPELDRDADLAEALGVSPAALDEARVLARDRLRASGRALHGRDGRRHAGIVFRIPEEVRADLCLYCEHRQIFTTELLRSIVQHYLVTSQPPGRTPDRPGGYPVRWTYRGRRLLRAQHWMHFRVSHGALSALERNATLCGGDRASFVRGAVLDVLEGRLRSFRIVSMDEMWDDAERYPCCQTNASG